MYRKKKKNKNLYNFFVYLFSILTISLFLICYLSIKNQCRKTSSEITELENALVKNINIVKDLQGEKEHYLSENYISKFLENVMIVTIPEPEIINMEND